MSLKRAASPPSKTLEAHPSPYHNSVTLFETPSPRRSKRVKREETTSAYLVDLEDVVEDYISPKKSRRTPSESFDTSAPTSLRNKSPRKVPAIRQSLDTPHPAPDRWRETYDIIEEMRAGIVAPVDTMGCEQAQLKEKDPKNRRFSTLVSLMLSSQTKDQVTDAAVSKLRDAVGGCLSVDAILEAEDSTISEAIAKVGFWRRKAGYIKQTAQRLRDDFDSDVPKTADELCSLPGVGPKMAFLALQVAWNLNLGIGVDVHVHRITNRLGWHRPPTKKPEETRLNLQSWLPVELHPKINLLLVGFGQTICTPTSPRCDMCELSSKGLCPSARRVVTSKTKDRKAIVWASSSSSVNDSKTEQETLLDVENKDLTTIDPDMKSSPTILIKEEI